MLWRMLEQRAQQTKDEMNTKKKHFGLQPLCVSLFLTAVLEPVVPYPLLLCAAASVAGAVVVGASFILLKAFGFSSNDTKKWNFYYFLSFALLSVCSRLP